MKLNVNGFIIEAEYTEQEIHSVFIPLLNEMTERRREKGKRLIVFLAAPPGTGKTTLSLYLEKLYSEHFSSFSFQSISIDGFHHSRDYLMSHYMIEKDDKILLNDIKGSPETFDVSALKTALQTLENEPVHWPLYDRNAHDVSEKKVNVDADIVLIEGNWLLLNEADWHELADYCDYSIFIRTDEKLLKTRLIERKLRGGVSREEADRFYEQSDSKNVKRVLANHLDPDMTLYLNNKKEIVKG